MPNIQQVSFQSPGYDYSAELAQIEQHKRLADALQAQSMEPLQQQTAGGWVVPISPMQGLAKLAQAYVGGQGQKASIEMQRELSQKAQNDYRSMLVSGINKLSGTPQSEDAAGNVTAAQAPDPMGAMGAFGSHPMGAQFMPLAMQEIQRQRLTEALRGPQAAPAPATPQGPSPQTAAAIGAPWAAGAPSAQPQQPQAQPPTGGPAGGRPMEAWLQIDPTGKLYMEQLAKDYTEGQKPVINRGYGIGRMVNGQYVPDAASLKQALEMERGKEGIHASYETVPVTNAAGATVQTFKPNIPGFPGATPPAAAPAAQPRPQPAPRPRPQPAAATPAAGDPWATMPKLETPQGVGQSTYQHTVQTQQGQTAHALSEKFGTLAASANDRRALGMQALGLIDSADTGPGAARIADIKNLLVSRFGVPESSFANTPSATISLQKDLLNAATQKAKQQFGARMTQSEVMLMLSKGAPNVDMTKAAMKYLITSDLATADYQIKQANDLGRYLSQGGDPMRFEGWYTQAFPLSGALGAVHLPGVKNETAGSTQVIDDLLKKYGRKSP